MQHYLECITPRLQNAGRRNNDVVGHSTRESIEREPDDHLGYIHGRLRQLLQHAAVFKPFKRALLSLQLTGLLIAQGIQLLAYALSNQILWKPPHITFRWPIGVGADLTTLFIIRCARSYFLVRFYGFPANVGADKF